MTSFRVDNKYESWFCYVTYLWQDPNHEDFREHAFGPFSSEEEANKWGKKYSKEIDSYASKTR